MNTCPPREQLERLTNKKLGPDDHAAVETHVSSCAACQQTVASLHPEVTQEWTPSQPDDPEPLSDRKLPAELRDHPRHRVTGVLGRGGMGTVPAAPGPSDSGVRVPNPDKAAAAARHAAISPGIRLNDCGARCAVSVRTCVHYDLLLIVETAGSTGRVDFTAITASARPIRDFRLESIP
jgi:hypothetical protein